MIPELDIRQMVASRQASSRQSVRCLERAVRSLTSSDLGMEDGQWSQETSNIIHLSSARSTLSLQVVIVSTVVISELWDCMVPTYSASYFPYSSKKFILVLRIFFFVSTKVEIGCCFSIKFENECE